MLGTVIEPLVEAAFFERVGQLTMQAEEDDLVTELAEDLRQAEAELAAYRDDPRIIGVLGPDRFVDGSRPGLEQSTKPRRRSPPRSEAAGTPVAFRWSDSGEIWPDLSVEERRGAFHVPPIDAVRMFQRKRPGAARSRTGS